MVLSGFIIGREVRKGAYNWSKKYLAFNDSSDFTGGNYQDQSLRYTEWFIIELCDHVTTLLQLMVTHLKHYHRPLTLMMRK